MITAIQERRLDRAVGAVIGSACGDALGAPLEFTSARRADGSDWVRDMVGGGAFGWRPGQTTDDTDMSRCVLEMYLENNGRYDQDLLVRKFLAWRASNPPDIGSWTRYALNVWADSVKATPFKGLKKVGTACYKPGYREHNPVLLAWRKCSRSSASNGGVMRCIPTALVHAPSMRNTSLDAAAICADTHPDPRSIASCVAVVTMATKLIRDTCEDGSMRGNKRGVYSMHEAWADILKTVLDLNTDLYTGLRTSATLPWGGWTNGGSAIETTVCAFAALLQASSFEEGLIKVVNRGGDADTVGAVAGGLLGARFGYSQIPKRWLERLEGHDQLRSMAIELWMKRRFSR